MAVQPGDETDVAGFTAQSKSLVQSLRHPPAGGGYTAVRRARPASLLLPHTASPPCPNAQAPRTQATHEGGPPPRCSLPHDGGGFLQVRGSPACEPLQSCPHFLTQGWGSPGDSCLEGELQRREGAGKEGLGAATASARSLLPAQLPGPAGGSLHGAHGGRPQPAPLQRMQPIDGGAARRARVCPQLSRVLPLLQQQLGCALGRGSPAVIEGGSVPLCSLLCLPSQILTQVSRACCLPSRCSADTPAYPSSHSPWGLPSLTSRVWAAMRWARPLGMPILMAPSAKASEKAHTCSSEGWGLTKLTLSLDEVPSLKKA